MTGIKLVLLAAVMIPPSITDIRERTISNLWPAALVLSGLVMVIVSSASEVWVSVGLAFLSAVILTALCRLISKTGFGMGDVKLILGLAVFLGVSPFLKAMMLTGIGTLAAAIFLLVTKRAEKEDTLPLAPFLATGALLSVLLEWREGLL